jgi:HAD superfamily hydrolase (TIGR01509 family)
MTATTTHAFVNPSLPSRRTRFTFHSSFHTTTMALQQSSSLTTNNDNDDNNNNHHFDFALLFDCDGVILETEELHRQAYNQAFAEFQLLTTTTTIDNNNNNNDIQQQQPIPVVWSVEDYDVLQNSIGGGIPKMKHYFRNVLAEFPRVGGGGGSGAAANEEAQQDALIQDIQTRKTEIYKSFMMEQKAQPRPGVLTLMDEALADRTVAVGVCSASTKEAALKVLHVTLGDRRVSQLNVCILGDDVTEKKPSPMIYNVARETLGIDDPKRCVVIEDSIVGLRAAKAAGMKCIVTYTSSTAAQDFYEGGEAAADAKVPDLQSRNVTLASIFDPLRRDLNAELLVGIKDPVEQTTAAAPPTTTAQS